MVVTSFPATRLIGCTHERTAWPFTCTVHAPQSAIPQPNLVPVRPMVSRITHSSGVSGSTSTEYIFPLTRNENMSSASQMCGDSRGAKPWVRIRFAHGDLPLTKKDSQKSASPGQPLWLSENGYYHSVSSVNPALAITRITVQNRGKPSPLRARESGPSRFRESRLNEAARAADASREVVERWLPSG